MYHIYVNDSLHQSVENINQVGAIVEQALQANPNAWVNVKDLATDQPLPIVALPLATPHPSIEFLTIPQIQALTPEEVADYWNKP
jgi:hypothetical protein